MELAFPTIIFDISLLVYFLSPIFLIMELYRDKKSKYIPYLFFFLNVLSSEFFVLLGISTKNKNLVVIFSIGLIINLFYVTIYISFLKISELMKCLWDLSVYISVTIIFYTFYVFFPDALNIRFISTILNLAVNFSPAQKVLEVFKTKNRYYLSLTIILAQLLKCIFSTIYKSVYNSSIVNVDNNQQELKFETFIDVIGIIVSLSLIFLYLYLGNPNKELLEIETDTDDENIRIMEHNDSSKEELNRGDPSNSANVIIGNLNANEANEKEAPNCERNDGNLVTENLNKEIKKYKEMNQKERKI